MRLITIKTDSLSPSLRGIASRLQGEAARRVTFAAAEEFKRITLANFGPVGEARPSEWAALSEKYAKWKKTDRVATLLLSENLRKSIYAVSNADGSATVGSDRVYAAAHQDGEGKMPLRPYFPAVGDRLTPYAEEKIGQVVESEIAKLLS